MADKAQYGFQSGIQVMQTALSVLSEIYKGAGYIVALDLAKAFDTILKLLMRGKLDENIDTNLTNQLTISLLAVKAKATGDISDTDIEMLRGLTQGETSSPALFKLFIDYLSQQVHTEMNRNGVNTVGMEPVGLVADDIIRVSMIAKGLQVLLQVCEQWAKENRLQWNPLKS